MAFAHASDEEKKAGRVRPADQAALLGMRGGRQKTCFVSNVSLPLLAGKNFYFLPSRENSTIHVRGASTRSRSHNP